MTGCEAWWPVGSPGPDWSEADYLAYHSDGGCTSGLPAVARALVTPASLYAGPLPFLVCERHTLRKADLRLSLGTL